VLGSGQCVGQCPLHGMCPWRTDRQLQCPPFILQVSGLSHVSSLSLSDLRSYSALPCTPVQKTFLQCTNAVSCIVLHFTASVLSSYSHEQFRSYTFGGAPLMTAPTGAGIPSEFAAARGHPKLPREDGINMGRSGQIHKICPWNQPMCHRSRVPHPNYRAGLGTESICLPHVTPSLPLESSDHSSPAAMMLVIYIHLVLCEASPTASPTAAIHAVPG
jgi:hypothetical protein